ncbi:MAG: anaerobic ribonucleoside-triphosphate reductase activating protein [Gallicola sp.]|nr:anaerobic ribonucleoside-triphosphate reductase activating protein [Gallicola sp.]
MRYGQIREFDIANGPGIRSSIFVTGCTQNCKNCFNKKYQDFNFGEEWSEDQTHQVLKYLEKDVNNGLTILGGEPFENTTGLLPIVAEIRAKTDKTIWIYSGYTFECLIQDEDNKKLLSFCDVLVDGPFIEEMKDLTLQFKGSSNQRIIDLNQSFKSRNIVLWSDRK